ncbi:RHS repeat-associated core domain-containing protein [Salinivibrio sp. ML290]|uniref:RHS repeat-associated core domain-containing protein n=1 Tax=Salinivibrio sp. ML290 TaxID=1909468 RepID=UPI001F5281C8|nr:RHS repeat-associated core domain-containing protein [Salinivibrio sp. ML290]
MTQNYEHPRVYNQSGDKVESHHYSLYGTASGDAFSQQPFGFSTKRNDFASGLVYFGYRFYVPHLGRWLNRDPLQEAGGINLYAYVNGDPLGYVDPDGKYSFSFDAYVGLGGGFTIGYSPSTSNLLFALRAGYGLEVGGGFDPRDDQYPSEGLQCGAEAKWGASVFGVGVEGQTRSDGLDVDDSPDNNLFTPKLTLDGLSLGKPSVSSGAHAGAYVEFNL